MPGPKMGPRPSDFNEEIVKQAPTFQKWLKLDPGETLRYACRDFHKGNEQDEERLMRRIMIARRNNLRDHEMLKRARASVCVKDEGGEIVSEPLNVNSAHMTHSAHSAHLAHLAPFPEEKEEEGGPVKKCKVGVTSRNLTDSEVLAEMDELSVTMTRSYRAWIDLEDGKEFVYNQKYTKGKDGHDFLLRKNIWRRMRYRRENKKMVETMKTEGIVPAIPNQTIININAPTILPMLMLHPPLFTKDPNIESLPPLITSQQIIPNTNDHIQITIPIKNETNTTNENSTAAAAARVSAANEANSEEYVHTAVVEAAVAAAASYVRETMEATAAAAECQAEDKGDMNYEMNNNVGVATQVDHDDYGMDIKVHSVDV